MSVYYIKNDILKIAIESKGAQLISVKREGREYLWCGDSEYWHWHSPLLFPFIGRLKHMKYTFEGKDYPVIQHGFARDLEFKLEKHNDIEIWFSLTWNKETYLNYPFKFKLSVGHRIMGNEVIVLWKVENQDTKEIFFSIGGHPGFCCPILDGTEQNEYTIHFHTDRITYKQLDEHGLLINLEKELPLQKGRFYIKEDSFLNDAYIIEPYQTRKVSLCLPSGDPYVTVEFEAPSVGIYSPEKKSPFVCIEPWYGRCDSQEFEGTIADRAFIQKVKKAESYLTSYKMQFMSV